EAVKISEALFTGNVEDLSAEEIEMGFKDLLSITLSTDENIVELLVKTGLAASKREAREHVQNNAVTVNGVKVTETDFMVTKTHAIGMKFSIIRKGKKKYSLIKHE
ncbi:MAG: S4 domain-containing protein, partial [Candidatus Izemoplasmatales bacterium]